MMKTGLTIAGVAELLMGLMWIGQGLGYIHWPATSSMLDQRPWAVGGTILAVIGVGLLVYARSRR